MEAEKPTKRNKTKKALFALSNEDRDKAGLEIERLIKEEMSYIVNRYLFRYQQAVMNTFGWDRDDLLQYIRMVLYKGYITFSAERKVKMTSYLSAILYYQMGNLSVKIQNKKNSQTKLYCPEVLYDTEEMIDQTSSEDWLNYSRKFDGILPFLNDVEKKLLVYHLVYGYSLKKMEQFIKSPRVEIIKGLKSLKNKLEDIK